MKHILHAVCSGAAIECRLKNNELTLAACIQKEIDSGRQAVLLLGNGGMGKTTTLVQTAMRICNSGKAVYLFQLGRDNDEQIIDEILHRIASVRDDLSG